MNTTMKKPRILFLLMSADMPFFKNQLEDCKNTWLHALNSADKHNKTVTDYVDIVGWYYYDVSFNEKCKLIKNEDGQNVIYLSPDGVIQDEIDNHHLINVLLDDNWTFQKTYDVFKYVTDNMDYDYIVRTNTSTYINIPLLSYILYKEFNDKSVDSGNTAYGTDLMSLHTLACPSYGDIYIRGNCLILSKHQVQDIILKYGQLYTVGISDKSLIDDVCIGNILNCYYNSFKKTEHRNFEYLKHIKCLPQMWYKCTEHVIDFSHTWCKNGYGQDFNEESADDYASAVAIQVRSYYTNEGRETTEHRHYNELYQHMKQTEYDENNLSVIYNKIKEYSNNPDVWVQGNMPYMKQDVLLRILGDRVKFINWSSVCMSYTPVDHQAWRYKERIMKENNVDFSLRSSV